MTITVAGNKKDVAEGLTVAQLVIDENVETPTVCYSNYQ